MDEKDEIIEEPKVETPDSGNKKKKRRPRKKKEEPKEEEPKEEQNEGQNEGQNEEQNEPAENLDNPLENLTVNVSFQFLMTIRDILINISPRVNWNAQELLPVGMILRDLNNISANVNEQFSNIAEGETEGDVEDDDDEPDPESEEIN